jgi:hypothetical protein
VARGSRFIGKSCEAKPVRGYSRGAGRGAAGKGKCPARKTVDATEACGGNLKGRHSIHGVRVCSGCYGNWNTQGRLLASSDEMEE